MASAALAAFLEPQIHFPQDFNTNFLMLVRWIHFLAGITWIGLLYFFNLVNVPLMKELDGSTKGKVMPLDGPLSISVPGSVGGAELAMRKYGTKSMAEVLAPAIELAERAPCQVASELCVQLLVRFHGRAVGEQLCDSRGPQHSGHDQVLSRQDAHGRGEVFG